ncbi:MAG: hypothetical protein KIT84_32205 [Labilithrix sp.]|nr:hypothetical protein [Labilithrix sp.]MCW5815736.1 hypothetical protein [Labilithrix sp.]
MRRSSWGSFAVALAVASCEGDCARERTPAAIDAEVKEAEAPEAPEAAAPVVDAGDERDASTVEALDASVQPAVQPAGAGDGGRKTPCPKVSPPSKGRVDACAAQGGTLRGVETDGCIRGYDCVK